MQYNKLLGTLGKTIKKLLLRLDNFIIYQIISNNKSKINLI